MFNVDQLLIMTTQTQKIQTMYDNRLIVVRLPKYFWRK